VNKLIRYEPNWVDEWPGQNYISTFIIVRICTFYQLLYYNISYYWITLRIIGCYMANNFWCKLNTFDIIFWRYACSKSYNSTFLSMACNYLEVYNIYAYANTSNELVTELIHSNRPWMQFFSLNIYVPLPLLSPLPPLPSPLFVYECGFRTYLYTTSEYSNIILCSIYGVSAIIRSVPLVTDDRQ